MIEHRQVQVRVHVRVAVPGKVLRARGHAALLQPPNHGRPEPPDDLRSQFGLVRQALEGFRIPVLDLAGYEADDIIATLTARARAAGMAVTVEIRTGQRRALDYVLSPLREVTSTAGHER